MIWHTLQSHAAFSRKPAEVHLYTLIVFLSSAGALTLEIVAGRMIAPYVGMSLYTWTAIIAVVLAGLSAGHWIGGFLANRAREDERARLFIAVALGAAAVSTLLSLPLLRLIADPIMAPGSEPVRAVLLLSTALFFLPSLFVGIISPLATKLALDANPDNSGHVLGRMFAAGALGSILGTLASGYLFISWIGTAGTVIAVAGLYAVLLLALVPSLRQRTAPLVVLIVPGLLAGTWVLRADAYVSPCDRESDYFCIRIDDFEPMSGRESRLMVLDHLVHSINDRNDPTVLYSPYVHFVDEVVRRLYPETGPASAFFVGGGGYTLPRAWAAAYPEARLTVAELDPAVTEVARDDLWFDAAPANMTIRHIDARVALHQTATDERYDVIFGDAFHDIAVPAHLVTHEFNELIASRLTENGIYALNLVDGARRPLFLQAMVRTLKKTFASVEVWLTSDVSLEDDRVTFILLAASRPSPLSKLTAQHGLERTWVRWPTDDLARRIEAADLPVLSDEFAPVERLLFPG